MMTRISGGISGWLGWCPNAPALRTAPAVPAAQPATMLPAQPDSGGAGGRGRVDRGIGIALRSTKTLVRNRQLLVFSLLTGLVMAFLFVAEYGIHLLGTYADHAIDVPRRLVLTFAVELVAVFCLTVLLAGLVLSLSREEEGSPAAFGKGLSRAKGYLQPLADWSVIVALSGTILCLVLSWSGYSYFSLSPLLDHFPFNFILLPEVYHPGPIGGTYALLSAVSATVVLAGINGLLFVLSLFVVPLLVLENRSLREAILGSAALMGRVWSEAIVCLLLPGGILSAVSLASLLFPAVYGIVAPGMLPFWYPGDAWIAAAALFMLGLCGLALAIATVAGIAAVNLYLLAKTGRLPAMPEGK